MASYKSNHGRSLSLPSDSNLSTSPFGENLSKIRASEATSSSSLSSINEKLNTLQMLYVNIEDSLLLSRISGISSQQILDGYIRLLDACSSAKDLVSCTKQQVQDLSSSIRRKDADGISAYLAARKRTKKMIEKSLKSLKSSTSMINENQPFTAISMLKEAESVTVSVIKSLLSYMMGNKSQSFVSKFMHSTTRVGVETEVNEFEKTNAMLRTNQEDVQVVNHLKTIDSSIQVTEEGLECLFRQQIKIRVSLFDVLNN